VGVYIKRCPAADNCQGAEPPSAGSRIIVSRQSDEWEWPRIPPERGNSPNKQMNDREDHQHENIIWTTHPRVRTRRIASQREPGSQRRLSSPFQQRGSAIESLHSAASFFEIAHDKVLFGKRLCVKTHQCRHSLKKTLTKINKVLKKNQKYRATHVAAAPHPGIVGQLISSPTERRTL